MPRPPVEVRRATEEDLDDLLLLWSHVREELARGGRGGPPQSLELFRPRLRELLASSDSQVLVGRYEGAPAGYVLVRIAPMLAVDGNALHIDHIFVLPPVRRRGIARALLMAATAVAERAGAEQILAGAPPSARDTHRFLARLGFSPLVVRRVVTTAALRRRLSGEGQRRGLEDLLSRRRSLRARAGRARGSDAEERAHLIVEQHSDQETDPPDVGAEPYDLTPTDTAVPQVHSVQVDSVQAETGHGETVHVDSVQGEAASVDLVRREDEPNVVAAVCGDAPTPDDPPDQRLAGRARRRQRA